MEEDELMDTIFNPRTGSVSAYVHESARTAASLMGEDIIDVVVWIEPKRYKWIPDMGWFP